MAKLTIISVGSSSQPLPFIRLLRRLVTYFQLFFFLSGGFDDPYTRPGNFVLYPGDCRIIREMIFLTNSAALLFVLFSMNSKYLEYRIQLY